MKRIIVSLLVMVMIITGISFVPQKVDAKGYVWCSTHPKKNSVQVKWDKVKKATKYVIYRASSKNYSADLKKSKFKKIKTIWNGKTKKYTDKKVKFNKYYAYYVKVYKGKKVYGDSYNNSSQDFACKGLSTPELYFNTNEDHFADNKYEIHFGLYDSNRGATFSKKFEFYRKQKGESKYKKISLKKVDSTEYYDSNLTKGQTYYYKAKCYTKKGKKKKYSMFSETKAVFAGNYNAQYKVTTIRPESGQYNNVKNMDIVIKVDSMSTLNGKTILCQSGDSYASYSVNTGGSGSNEQWHYYYAKVVGYSYNDKIYNAIPKKGIDLNGKDTYLKISLKTRSDWGNDEDYMNERIVFGGNNCEYASSYLDLSGLVTYYGPGEPSSYCNLNLKTGKAFIHS